MTEWRENHDSHDFHSTVASINFFAGILAVFILVSFDFGVAST